MPNMDIKGPTLLVCGTCKQEVEFCTNHNTPYHADREKIHTHFVSEVVELCQCGVRID